MKSENTQLSTPFGAGRALILLLAALAITITVACSRDSKPAVSSSSRSVTSSNLRPATLPTVESAAALTTPVAMNATAPAKPSASKLILYRSRDYGVSFQYPWQYAFLSARAVAGGDSSLQPKPDRHDGQFTLARVDIPKGFYPDTDFDSGYFILSLNPDLDQQQCESVVAPGPGGKAGTESINGVDYRWMEIDSGGSGSAVRLRNYVSFSNGICYELETGVKTSNHDGMARELDPDQVFRRLNGILKSVTILPSTRNPAAPQVESSAAVPGPMSER